MKNRSSGAIFDLIYVAMMTNLLLVVGAFPLVVGLLATDPARSWPLLAVVTPLCAPALSAAFAVMAAYSGEGSTQVVRTFARAWQATFRRAATLGAIATAALVVLGVDIAATWTLRIGAVVIPVMAVLMLLIVATSLLALVAIAERPAVRLGKAVRVCGYLAVRRWYLTIVSLAMLLFIAALLAAHPALELGIAATPLLYIVWANSRFTLRPALGMPAGAPSKA